eukprot:TRINITY_DN21910_c0_g1_i1.p2 TRINITY_DN21910_c0_g1~~TRINITY_DN21910_c0_g1_i1.p2  ORF type:complete len:129 (+),score=36.64 TRINITY_DN21910_c0_g1_i1:152-538(+)
MKGSDLEQKKELRGLAKELAESLQTLVDACIVGSSAAADAATLDAEPSILQFSGIYLARSRGIGAVAEEPSGDLYPVQTSAAPDDAQLSVDEIVLERWPTRVREELSRRFTGHIQLMPPVNALAMKLV